MGKVVYTKELLQDAVDNCLSFSSVIRYLGKKPSGGMHRLITAKIKEFGIDTKHFKGQGWSRGFTEQTNKTVARVTKKISFTEEQVFQKGKSIRSGTLRKWLLKKRDYKCEICGLTKWLDKDITLHVDHIDGDNTNNLLDNLRFICPNCHQQTETWGSINR